MIACCAIIRFCVNAFALFLISQVKKWLFLGTKEWYNLSPDLTHSSDWTKLAEAKTDRRAARLSASYRSHKLCDPVVRLVKLNLVSAMKLDHLPSSMALARLQVVPQFPLTARVLAKVTLPHHIMFHVSASGIASIFLAIE